MSPSTATGRRDLRHAGRRLRVPAGAVLGALFGILYACFLTRNYYWDGLSFAIDIERAQGWRDLFNVHHLLYNLIGYGEYVLLGRSVRSLYLMQWTNCVAGGAMVWLSFRLMRSLEVPVANSAACAAIIGTAATFWKFSSDADSYILANVFLIGAYLTVPKAPRRGALLHVCALMIHQLAALFWPVALALLWRRNRERFRRAALEYTALSGGLTLVLYWTAYRLATQRLPLSFPAWLTFHAQVPFVFNPAGALGWLALGTARLFVGGRPSPVAYVVAPVSLALLVWGLRRLLTGRGRFAPVLPHRPLLIWAGVYVCFLLAWEPYNTFYRLFYLTPLIALAAIATRHLTARPLAAIAGALCIWNFFVYIYPNTRVEKNQLLVYALAQQKQWPAGTGIIFSELVPDLWTISYFNPQVSWIFVRPPDARRVAAYRAEFARHGGKLYLDGTYLRLMGRPAPRFYFEPVEGVPEK